MHHRSLSSSVNLEEKFLKMEALYIWYHYFCRFRKKSLFLKDFYIIGLHLLQLQIFDMKTILLHI